MNRISLSVAVASLLAVSSALAQSDCTAPAAVDMPDGAAATLEQMLDAQSAVRDYLTEMETYLECMNEQIDDADDETPPEVLNGWITQYNTSVDEMEQTAARFNEERVAYQQANPSE